jgi:hypothetical protein
MAHTGAWHDWLEGLPPKVFSISPGYYCATRLPKSLNSHETLSRVYYPPTTALISRATGRLGLHAPRPRLYQPLDLVVPLQDCKKMVEVLNAHIFDAEITNDEAKLNWPTFVFPKAWCGSGL